MHNNNNYCYFMYQHGNNVAHRVTIVINALLQLLEKCSNSVSDHQIVGGTCIIVYNWLKCRRKVAPTPSLMLAHASFTFFL